MGRGLPRSPVSLWRPLEADPTRYFSAEEVAKSKAYKRPLQRASALSALISSVALLVLVGAEFAPRLLEGIGVRGWVLQLLIVNALFGLILGVATLPIEVWKEFVHEKRWGFSTQTPRGYAIDQIKEYILNVLIISVLIFLPIWALIRATDLWWIYGAAVLVIVIGLLRTVYPILILPRFNKLTPLQDEDLRARFVSLAARARVHISEYLVMDASKRTKKDNAFFTGMGKTRRVVIYDNMLEMAPEQVGVVLGHELGHWRRGHLRRGTITSLLTGPILLGGTKLIVSWQPALDFAGVDHAGDPAALPLFVGALGATFMLTRYLDAWLGRHDERQADMDALELTGDPEAYRGLFLRFAARDLPDLDPSWWERIKGTHPPIAERIAFADVWEGARAPAG